MQYEPKFIIIEVKTGCIVAQQSQIAIMQENFIQEFPYYNFDKTAHEISTFNLQFQNLYDGTCFLLVQNMIDAIKKELNTKFLNGFLESYSTPDKNNKVSKWFIADGSLQCDIIMKCLNIPKSNENLHSSKI